LIQKINNLDSENDELSLEITKKNYKIKQIKTSLAEGSSSNVENIRKRIKSEKQNRKNLEISAGNLKKAVNELKTRENLVFSSNPKDQDVGWHLAEIEVLQKTNSELIKSIDLVKKDLRNSVPYTNIRSFICTGCSSKLKSEFGSQIFHLGSKDMSILNSILMYRRNERPSSQEKSCNCRIF
jgi:predicted  nucleic acid-binding Zn-ribbon protein